MRSGIATGLLCVLGACSGTGVSDGAPRDAGTLCPTDLQELAEQFFSPNCTSTGCHGSDGNAGGLDLESAELPLELIGRESNLCTGEVLVVAGDADSSLLIAKLRGAGDCGVPMPVGGMLAPETVDCIASWIDQLDPSGACESCGGASCIDLNNDLQNCGACGQTCPPGSSCVDGGCACSATLTACESGCADLMSNPENCGRCDNGCAGLVCLAGTCSADCGALTECDGACVDLDLDPLNCGSCGTECSAGSSCDAGQCVCSGTSVSFSGDVQPILTGSCTAMGCHDGVGGPRGGPGGGATSLDLTLGNAYESLLNATTPCGPVVLPGQPGASLLIGKLTGSEICMGTRMPKGDPPLAGSLIDTISSWICQGAQNN